MTRRICCTLAVLVLLVWLVTAESGAQPNAGNPNAVKLQELLQERHDALEKLYEVVKSRHDDGTLHYELVVPVLDDLLKAKLELAPSKQERLELCRKRVDNLRFLEEIAEARLKVRSGLVDAKLLATAARLQAEIDCLREESKPE
jgi:hypothetical protein